MKKTGEFCSIDKLGRVLIPIRIRRKYDFNPDNKLEILTEDDCIILKKYIPTCTFCTNEDDLVEFGNKYLCQSCKAKISEL